MNVEKMVKIINDAYFSECTDYWKENIFTIIVTLNNRSYISFYCDFKECNIEDGKLNFIQDDLIGSGELNIKISDIKEVIDLDGYRFRIITNNNLEIDVTLYFE